MISKTNPGGYLMIDHRESPGLSEGEARIPGVETMPTRKGMFFESDTRRCGHCPRQVILNPLRTRERGWCSKCDHYICDECEAVRVATGVCRPWQKVVDDFIDAGAKGKL